MRNSFLRTMIELAEKDDAVSLLMAEVGFSVVEPFEKKFPDRFYNTGISEQNLVLTAAGMAVAGMKPVAYSMSAFLPSRAFEMIKVSVCYQNLPVTLVSVGSGLSYGELGSTHHSIEESALMRSLPNMTVIFPSDGDELSEALRYANSRCSPFYISFPKAPSPAHEAHPFEANKAVRYREGKDGAVLAAGYSVHSALKAAENLKLQGIDLSVYGFHTVKPLDQDAIMEAAATGCIFTVDEHQYCAGFGAEAARVILENGALIRKFRDFSIPDCFVENVSGYGELLDKYELSADRLSAGIASMYK